MTMRQRWETKETWMEEDNENPLPRPNLDPDTWELKATYVAVLGDERHVIAVWQRPVVEGAPPCERSVASP
jgi:hypothetical protein